MFLSPPNLQKRVKVKDLNHAGKCLRKRKLKVEKDMDILMALIDLKVVSRVLRMHDLSEEQLHWCEEMENGRCRDGSRANHGACGSWIGMVVPIGLELEGEPNDEWFQTEAKKGHWC